MIKFALGVRREGSEAQGSSFGAAWATVEVLGVPADKCLLPKGLGESCQLQAFALGLLREGSEALGSSFGAAWATVEALGVPADKCL